MMPILKILDWRLFIMIERRQNALGE